MTIVVATTIVMGVFGVGYMYGSLRLRARLNHSIQVAGVKLVLDVTRQIRADLESHRLRLETVDATEDVFSEKSVRDVLDKIDSQAIGSMPSEQQG